MRREGLSQHLIVLPGRDKTQGHSEKRADMLIQGCFFKNAQCPSPNDQCRVFLSIKNWSLALVIGIGHWSFAASVQRSLSPRRDRLLLPCPDHFAGWLLKFAGPTADDLGTQVVGRIRVELHGVIPLKIGRPRVLQSRFMDPRRASRQRQ